jgi:hypothetical protein
MPLIRQIASLTALLVLTVSCFGIKPKEQEPCHVMPNDSEIMDLVFPRHSQPSLMTVWLRLQPSARPESQIEIRKDLAGKVSVRVWELTPGSRSIALTTDELVKKGICEPAKIAGQIKINIRYLSPRQGAHLLHSLQETPLNINEDRALVVDGSVYEFWAETLNGRSYVEVGFQTSRPFKNQLMKWMDEAAETANVPH